MTPIYVSLLLVSLVGSAAGNCLLGARCGAGACCSAYGFCGTGSYYCGAVAVVPTYAPRDCRLTGCGAGYCCSSYGYCGTSYEHCGGVVHAPVVANCRVTGCPAGTCCSAYGYCGNTAAHCGVVTYGNCGYTACGSGLCCTRYGYCGAYGAYGAYGAHCALAKTLKNVDAATLEGEFRGEATFYNETLVSTDYSLCGTERARSLDDGEQKVFTAALNKIQFDPYTVDGIPSKNPVCQKKALVKGPAGEVVVRFVDRCPDCQQGDVALTEEAFLIINGELGTGHADVEWHFL